MANNKKARQRNLRRLEKARHRARVSAGGDSHSGAGGERWKEALLSGFCMNSMREDLRAWIDANEAGLDAAWGRTLEALSDAEDDAVPHPETLYQRLQRGRPPCAFLEFELGNWYMEQDGRLHRARRHYERAVVLSPGVAPYHAQLGLCYHLLGLGEDMLRAYLSAEETACALDSETLARACFNIGVYHWNRRDTDKGREYLRRALEAWPEYPEARAMLRLVSSDEGSEILP